MKNLVLVALLALVGGLMTMGGHQAQAGDVSCGDTLTADTALHEGLTCAGAGLTIGADDITLNCKGHTLTGNGTNIGIRLDGVSGVTVKNCHVSDFGIGFSLQGSSGNTLKENAATGNTSPGSGAYTLRSGSNGNTLKENTATGNSGRGFLVGSGSSENTLKENIATGNNFRGFDLGGDSNDNTFKGNVAIDNGSAGFVVSDGATGNVLKGNVSTRSSFEGFAIFSSGNTLKGNTADLNGTYGIRDTTGPLNTYIGNTCSGNFSGPSSPAGLC